jgi:hypothetical protein
MNRTVDFDVLLSSKIRHLLENQEAAPPLTFALSEACPDWPQDQNRTRSWNQNPAPPQTATKAATTKTPAAPQPPKPSTGCRAPENQRRRGEPNPRPATHRNRRRRIADPPNPTRRNAQNPKDLRNLAGRLAASLARSNPPSGEDPIARHLSMTPFLSCPLGTHPVEPEQEPGLQSVKEPVE